MQKNIRECFKIFNLLIMAYLLAAITIRAASLKIETADNLLRNNTFEETDSSGLPLGFGVDIKPPDGARLSIKNKSAVIEILKSGAWARLYQDVDTDPDEKNFVIGGSYSLAGSGSIRIKIMLCTESGGWITKDVPEFIFTEADKSDFFREFSLAGQKERIKTLRINFIAEGKNPRVVFSNLILIPSDSYFQAVKKIGSAISSIRQALASAGCITAACTHVLVGSANIPGEFYTNAEAVDILMPMWFDITDSGDITPRKGCGAPYDTYKNFCNEKNIFLMPIVRNFKPAVLLQNHQAAQKAAAAITELAKQERYHGVLVDIENLKPEQSAEYHALTAAVYTEFKKNDLILSVAVPSHAWGDYDYKKITENCDLLFVMFYDYTGVWNKNKAGAGAPLSWNSNNRDILRDLRDILAAGADRKKILFGIGFHGNDYTYAADGSIASVSSAYWDTFSEKLLTYKAQAEWDDESQTPFFRYTDKDGNKHMVWYENAQSVSRKIQVMKKNQLRGVGLWTFTSGSAADPEIWKIIRQQ